MSDTPDDLTAEEQNKVIAEIVDKARTLVAWIDAAPNIDGFVGPVLIGAMAAKQSMTDEGLAEEEIDRIGKWLERRYIDLMVLSGVARGHLGMRWDTDTNEPAFCLTPLGKEVAGSHDKEST